MIDEAKKRVSNVKSGGFHLCPASGDVHESKMWDCPFDEDIATVVHDYDFMTP